MNGHLNDAELVALALLPDDDAEARIHLAGCQSCTSRMDKVAAEVAKHREDHEASIESRDATFWKRQELAIMRNVAKTGSPAAARRSFVAAAIIAVAIGGFWFGRTTVQESTPGHSSPAAIASATSSTTPRTPDVVVPAAAVSTDPWDTETLEEFQPVVDWESWVEDDRKDQGTI